MTGASLSNCSIQHNGCDAVHHVGPSVAAFKGIDKKVFNVK